MGYIMIDYKEQDYNRLYEHEYFYGCVEDTLRPGGIELTAANLERSGLPAGSKILDIGCGCGKTVKFLRDQMQMEACGIDKSKTMIMNGLLLDNTLDIRAADAAKLPFADDSFDAVTAECVFCLLPDKDTALAEIKRVLKPHGQLIISDMYLREPSEEPVCLSAVTCLQNLMTEDEIRSIITAGGFVSDGWYDCHSEYLGFLGELIFSFDSVQGFWQCLVGDCENLADSKERLKRKKISYYSAIWHLRD